MSGKHKGKLNLLGDSVGTAVNLLTGWLAPVPIVLASHLTFLGINKTWTMHRVLGRGSAFVVRGCGYLYKFMEKPILVSPVALEIHEAENYVRQIGEIVDDIGATYRQTVLRFAPKNFPNLAPSATYWTRWCNN